GAFAEGSWAWWDGGWGLSWWVRQRSWVQWLVVGVGDGGGVGGSGDGDGAAVVQAMVIGAEQDQVGQLGRAAVFPVPDVVGVQTAGGIAAGNHTGAVAVFEGAAQPPVDQPGRSARADDLAVALEPHFTAGITGQLAAFGVAEQRAQMQGGGALLNVEVCHHGGVLG